MLCGCTSINSKSKYLLGLCGQRRCSLTLNWILHHNLVNLRTFVVQIVKTHCFNTNVTKKSKLSTNYVLGLHLYSCLYKVIIGESEETYA